MKKYFIYFCIVGLLISTSFAKNIYKYELDDCEHYNNYGTPNSNNVYDNRSRERDKQTIYKSCTVLFKEYDIDPEVRSPNGWLRIYKSGTLYNYLRIPPLNKNKTKILINCLIKNAFKIENYQRKIGNKKNKKLLYDK
jgi:hypothetical protein